jgi:hypothetical protein
MRTLNQPKKFSSEDKVIDRVRNTSDQENKTKKSTGSEQKDSRISSVNKLENVYNDKN